MRSPTVSRMFVSSKGLAAIYLKKQACFSQQSKISYPNSISNPKTNPNIKPNPKSMLRCIKTTNVIYIFSSFSQKVINGLLLLRFNDALHTEAFSGSTIFPSW